MTPWAQTTSPSAMGRGLTTNRAGESRVNRTQAIQMSRMLSSAPTS